MADPDPLTIWLKDVETEAVNDFSVTELLLGAGHSNQIAPIFGPTLAKLTQIIQAQHLPAAPAPTSDLPQTFLARADEMIGAVETVQQAVRAAERLALVA